MLRKPKIQATTEKRLYKLISKFETKHKKADGFTKIVIENVDTIFSSVMYAPIYNGLIDNGKAIFLYRIIPYQKK